MSEVDLTHIRDLLAGVPAVRLPPAGNNRTGKVSSEEKTIREQPPRVPARSRRGSPSGDAPPADPLTADAVGLTLDVRL